MSLPDSYQDKALSMQATEQLPVTALLQLKAAPYTFLDTGEQGRKGLRVTILNQHKPRLPGPRAARQAGQ